MAYMVKILMATGNKLLEYCTMESKKDIEKLLDDKVEFESVSYREGVSSKVGKMQPNIVVVKDDLEGDMTLLDLILAIRKASPLSRIIFLARDRRGNDVFFTTLLQFKVYDILVGEPTNLEKLIESFGKINTLEDAKKVIFNTL